MAVYIDIITGFLASGKTSFINELIKKNCMMEYSRSVLVMCEEGIEEYDENLLQEHRIDLFLVNERTEIEEDFFRNIYNEYSPDNIVIEFNGTWDISLLLNQKLPFGYRFRNVIFIGEGESFHSYLGNMASFIQPQIKNSDIVLLNRQQKLNKQQMRVIRQDIRKINRRTEVQFYNEAVMGDIISRYFPPHEKYFRISSGTKLGVLLMLSAILISDRMLLRSYTLLQSISTVFLGILIEALPFVLIGAIISSLIQLFMPSERIRKGLSDRKITSFFLASIAGFFMPVCDCGIVPIVSGLLKKDAPLSQTMTFWLASSAVNPIVLASVYYAFPERPYLVIVRAATGVAIAVITGLILQISRVETKRMITDLRQSRTIGEDMPELNFDGSRGKIEAVMKGARYEFFRVMKYLIFGAFISSLIQTLIPQTTKTFFGSSLIMQQIVMIAAAIFMSTCSTSNAFIGRSFLRNFQMMPIMSYIVLGPMLDIKNMMMLSEIIKKKYLVLLGTVISLMGYILFIILSRYLI